MSGMANRTSAERCGDVMTIMTAAPMNRKRLRSASDAEAPNVVLMSVVSADRRDTSSPARELS